MPPRRLAIPLFLFAALGAGAYLLLRSRTTAEDSGTPAADSIASIPGWAQPLLSREQRDEAERLGVAAAFEEQVTGMRFALIPAGTFTMGSPEGESGSNLDEGPQHRVNVPAFYLSIHETTNAQYRRFRSDYVSAPCEEDGKPYALNGDGQPVVGATHDATAAFAAWLSERASGPAAGTYALPTETQWEYAARAGTTTRFSFGDRDEDLSGYGNFSDRNDPSGPNSMELDDGHGEAAPVGSYRPNGWGLFDMHGNVWEWCADDFHSSYAAAPSDGSARIGSPRTPLRVLRGGSWQNAARFARSAYRLFGDPTNPDDSQGFRLARAVTPK